MPKCDEFVPIEQAAAALEYLHINNLGTRNLKSLTNDMLIRVAYETKATHLVILDYKQLGNFVEFRPNITDVFRTLSTESKLSDIACQDLMDMLTVKAPRMGEDYNDLIKESAFSFMITLIPNAIVYGPSWDHFQTSSTGEPTYDKKVKSSLWLRQLGRIGVDSVSHPEAFATWDLSFSLSPSLLTFTQSEKNTPIYGANRSLNTSASSSSTDSYYMLPQYNVGVTAHTVMGSFGLSAGAGQFLGILAVDDSYVADIGSAGNAEISYTAFVSRNVFIRAGARRIALLSEPRPFRERQINRYFTSTFARVGVFLPVMQRAAKFL